VTLTRGFWMGDAEVTQAQYQAIMGENPSYVKGDDLPVDMVSWQHALEFCRKLSEKEGKAYTLPTEAQWEYAARAGKGTVFFFGDDMQPLREYAWCGPPTGWKPRAVKKQRPNPFGLYDIYGNVSEWCLDWYQDSYEGLGTVDPTGPPAGRSRVVRGAGVDTAPAHHRSAVREGYSPDIRNRYIRIGFRVVMLESGTGN
jgi:formylglycine-generating enzyme required for sulfatase activity